MHLLDTDTLTHLYAGHPAVIERLNNLESEVGITLITKAEMLRGRIDYLLKAATSEDLLRAQQLLIRTEELLAQLLVLPINSKAAEQFDRLRTVRSLRKIGRADLLIASITLAYRAILVTRNVRHFKQISGMTVINWVD